MRLPARSVEVLALAALLVGAAACLAIATVFPMSPQAPRVLGVVMLVVALGLAGAVFALGDRLPRSALLGVVLLATVLNSALVANAHTSGGAMTDALAFGLLTAYVALLFPRVALPFAAFAAAMLGGGLLLSDLPHMVSPWAVTTLTLATAAGVLGRVSLTVRRHLVTDPLTQALNRSGLQSAAGRVAAGARRSGENVALAVIDFDDFKAVNDRAGHAGGDRLLVDSVARWRASLRREDVLARIGGDEFVVLMPSASPAQASVALRRLRTAHGAPWSAGVTVWRPWEPLEDCIARADRHLYAAKRRQPQDAVA